MGSGCVWVCVGVCASLEVGVSGCGLSLGRYGQDIGSVCVCAGLGMGMGGCLEVLADMGKGGQRRAGLNGSD